MQASSSRKPPSLGALTGARFLAASYVVLFHFHRHALEASQPWLFRLLSAGFLSVGFFFVLSGFILAYAYGAQDFAQAHERRAFWQNRVARVYPLYLFSMALGVLSAVQARWISLGELGKSLGLQRLAAVVLVWPMLWEKAVFVFNWAAWSLLSEAVFYAAFPWLYRQLVRRSTRQVLGLCLGFSVLTMVVLALYQYYDLDGLERPLRLGDERTRYGHWIRFSPIAHLHEFGVGLAAALLARRYQSALQTLRARHVDAFVAVLAMGSIVGASMALDVGYVFLHSGALAPVFAGIVVLLSTGQGRIAHGLGTELFQRLDRASYALYLVHVPAWFLLQRVSRGWSDAKVLGVYSLGILCAAWVLHVLLEEPARRWLRAKPQDAARDRPMVGL